MVHIGYSPEDFLDPTAVFTADYMPYRATLVERDGLWHVEEEMNRYEEQDDPFGSIAIPGDRTITIVSPDPVWDGRFGVAISQEDKIQQEEATKDVWNIDGIELVRIHKTPRSRLFDPRLNTKIAGRRFLQEMTSSTEMALCSLEKHVSLSQDPFQIGLV